VLVFGDDVDNGRELLRWFELNVRFELIVCHSSEV
jgi:hypothetical protein